jgi:hypothetical protein
MSKLASRPICKSPRLPNFWTKWLTNLLKGFEIFIPKGQVGIASPGLDFKGAFFNFQEGIEGTTAKVENSQLPDLRRVPARMIAMVATRMGGA